MKRATSGDAPYVENAAGKAGGTTALGVRVR
jgi:hypothetical protein